ncbi:response regulator [Paraflavisolibacter sp. H34]|uniref:response regulator n=1 Tax=Huijunlia imazamoxiresistens TaxID=3127457 RepID=UPI00301A80BD
MAPTAFHIRRILFIEDGGVDYTVFREALEKVDAGIELYFLPGCNYSHFGAGTFIPDLIFLTLKSPGKEHAHCLRQIRNSDYAAIPVIMYAANGGEEQVQKAYRDGASLYLVKPVLLQELVSCLKKILKEMNWGNPAQVTRSFCIDGKYIALKGRDMP